MVPSFLVDDAAGLGLAATCHFALRRRFLSALMSAALQVGLVLDFPSLGCEEGSTS